MSCFRIMDCIPGYYHKKWNAIHYLDVFEIGGRKKGFDQVKQSKNAFLACDEIELGVGAKIPLWMFGFLY